MLGIGALQFPPSGKFSTFKLEDGSGRYQTMYYKCEGENNNSKPVIMIESDFSHGVGDFLYLQSLLISKLEKFQQN